MQVFGDWRKIDVRLERLAEDTLFRSIGRNGGSASKQQDTMHRGITVYPSSPCQSSIHCSLRSSQHILGRLHCNLSEWEADHQRQMTWSLIRSFLGWMQDRSINLHLVQQSCFCFTRSTSSGALSFQGMVPISFKQRSSNHLLKDLDGTTHKVLVTPSKTLCILQEADSEKGSRHNIGFPRKEEHNISPIFIKMSFCCDIACFKTTSFLACCQKFL